MVPTEDPESDLRVFIYGSRVFCHTPQCGQKACK